MRKSGENIDVFTQHKSTEQCLGATLFTFFVLDSGTRLIGANIVATMNMMNSNLNRHSS
jgi:hypothetical protein